MSVLRIKLERGVIREHYQRGMQRLMELPMNFGKDIGDGADREFFAYLSTLGGGLVGGDSYAQIFDIKDSRATVSSQSSQKIYKGQSRLTTRICVDNQSSFVYHNDANIFYQNSDFISDVSVFIGKNSSLFYLDGGFLGYANAQFLAKMSFRLYVDYKLSINDMFYYDNRNNLNALFKHDYFYTIIMRNAPEFETVQNDRIKLHTSNIDGTTIIRILADDNDEAMDYITDIKNKFLEQEKMTKILRRQ